MAAHAIVNISIESFAIVVTLILLARLWADRRPSGLLSRRLAARCGGRL